MHLFIDTNIFIDFYESSKDSLVELEKLQILVKKGKIKLWLPDQVRKEFWKHREPAIEKNLATFEKAGVMGIVPCLVKEDAEFAELAQLVDAAGKKRAEIVARIREEVAEEQTQADKLVRSLFDVAQEIETEGELFQAAHERALRHLPPGKTDGVGDRVCWEALLSAVPEKEDLIILSDDGDYASEADPDTMSSYLRHEWKTKKKSDVTLWRRMSKFLAVHVPDAATAIEAEQMLLVQAVRDAGNFMQTHRAVAALTEVAKLKPALAEQLAQAVIENTQVHWIIEDSDVNKLVMELLKHHAGNLEPASRKKLEDFLAEAEK